MEQVWNNQKYSPGTFDSPGAEHNPHPQQGSTPHQDTPGSTGGQGMGTPGYLGQDPQFLNFYEEELAPHQQPPTEDDFFLLSSELDGLAPHHPKQHTAYPPSLIPENTPSLMAKKGGRVPEGDLDEGLFALPILPSQNDRLYNEEHLYHKQKTQYHQMGVRPDAVFTPLVLPAVTPMDKYQQALIPALFEPLTLPALSAANGDDRRRSLSLAFQGDGEPQYQTKRRTTPHGTPVMAPVKLLPSIRSRNSEFRQPENYPRPKTTASAQSSGGESTPLMGFTMGILAEQERDKSGPDPHSLRSHQNQSIPPPSLASLVETLPRLAPVPTKRGEKPPTKKALHKLAEQGRRNRMNQAVYDLGKLIPKSYHEQVSIPSKATTVELALAFIRDLIERVDELEKKE